MCEPGADIYDATRTFTGRLTIRVTNLSLCLILTI
jgi:hypothetical protein